MVVYKHYLDGKLKCTSNVKYTHAIVDCTGAVIKYTTKPITAFSEVLQNEMRPLSAQYWIDAYREAEKHRLQCEALNNTYTEWYKYLKEVTEKTEGQFVCDQLQEIYRKYEENGKWRYINSIHYEELTVEEADV